MITTFLLPLLALVPPAALAQAAPDVGIPAWHALLVGVQDYDDPRIPDLSTPETDVADLGLLLCERYGFGDVRVLTAKGARSTARGTDGKCALKEVTGGPKATRGGILQSLRALRTSAGPDDAVVVYFAGHGIQDADAGQGYWFPTDASRDNPDNWISNSDVRDQVKALPARHVLLVSDACYSGSLLTRDVLPVEAPKDLAIARRIAAKKSRWVITSGGNEPVMDRGGGGHSVFARYLLDVLAHEEGPFVNPGSFFFELKKLVVSNAEQTPEIAPLKMAGDEGGELVLVNRAPSATGTPAAPVVGSGSTGSNADIARAAACLSALDAAERKLRVQATAEWAVVAPRLSGTDSGTRELVQMWAGKWGAGKVVASACDKSRALDIAEAKAAQDWLNADFIRQISAAAKTVTPPKPAPNPPPDPAPTPAPAKGANTPNILLSPEQILSAKKSASGAAPPPRRVPRASDRTYEVGGVKFTMVRVEPGTFTMGSPEGTPERGPEETAHRVTIGCPYRMGETEVTQALWIAVMGSSPDLNVCPECAIVSVNWCDAVLFTNALSTKLGLVPAYSVPRSMKPGLTREACNAVAGKVKWNPLATGFRLPTETEWEYAARAGAQTTYAGSDDADQVAWHDGNSSKRLHEVAEKAPNDWGLYDMSGNVDEWCWDWSAAYPEDGWVDPSGPDKGEYRVFRGGSWWEGVRLARVAARDGYDPGWSIGRLGLRVVGPAD